MTRKTYLLGGLSAAALLTPNLALAQDAQDASEAQSSGINTIVVTAQKRAENVQDVPIAITAFGGDALAERNLSDVASLGNVSPSVTLDAGLPFSGSSAALGAFIRGIGQNDFAINTDPGVGVYIDGVYLARAYGANVDLPDVERVEILKGPQGTLFGRNTIGGAISVVTRDPGDSFAVKGAVTAGRYNRLDANASIDVPLTEDLAALVTFSTKNRDGYYRRIPYTQSTPFVTDRNEDFREAGYSTSDDEGGEDIWSTRVKLMYRGDRVTVRLTGDYTRVDQSSLPNSVLGLTTGPGAFAGLNQFNLGPAFGFPTQTALDVITGTSGFNFAGLYNFCIGATPGEIAARSAGNLCGARGTPLNPGSVLPGLGSVNVDGDPTNDRLPWDDRWISNDPNSGFASGPSFSEVTNWGFSGIVDFDITDDMQLRSITGYRELNQSYGFDGDNSPLAMLHISGETDQWQFSEELQLTGSLLGDSLNFVLGGYYFKEEGDERGWANFAAGAAIQVEGPVSIATENLAAFGQIDWRINDLIGITVGGRYTHEDKDFEAGQVDYNGFSYKLFNCTDYNSEVLPCPTILGFPNANDPLRFYPAGTQSKSFNNFSPKFGVQLHPNEGVMVYGSFSQGYKAGGWSTRLEQPVAVAPDFAEEEASTWELGVKADLLNRRLRANLAAFTTQYSDIQLLFQDGASPLIRNAGEARIKGVELELTAQPVDVLTITAAMGYIDARLTSILSGSISPPNQFQAGLIVGAQLPKVPEWKINISPRLELPLGNGGSIISVLDYTHLSSTWNDSQRTFLLRRPATDMLNGSVTYEEPDGRWRISVGGTNITGERYIVNGFAQLQGGIIYGSYNRPAEWYASFGFDF